jgi:hypothetical protein
MLFLKVQCTRQQRYDKSHPVRFCFILAKAEETPFAIGAGIEFLPL